MSNLSLVLSRADGATTEVCDAVDYIFNYQQWNATQVDRGDKVRRSLADAVKAIIANVPPCPDRDSAIRKLREARMDCNSAITFEGRL